MGNIKAEYIWMDGHEPTQKLRSKTKIIDGPISSVDDIPNWGFDGSSTMQAKELTVTVCSSPSTSLLIPSGWKIISL